MGDKENTKLKGALLTFVILQLLYLFYFFIQFPDSLRNSVGMHPNAADAIASWLSTLTMLGYCILCMVAVAQLVMRKPAFLLWFQIAGLIALAGNFSVYVLRQVTDNMRTLYSYRDGSYYWTLFIAVLFWTVIWCMYFARSSRVFSYMGEDAAYLKKALFTKNIKEPAPWKEPQPVYPVYPPAVYPSPQPGQPPRYGAPVYPPQQQGMPITNMPPVPPQPMGYGQAPPAQGYVPVPPVPPQPQPAVPVAPTNAPVQTPSVPPSA